MPTMNLRAWDFLWDALVECDAWRDPGQQYETSPDAEVARAMDKLSAAGSRLTARQIEAIGDLVSAACNAAHIRRQGWCDVGARTLDSALPEHLRSKGR